jgi:predicted esterase
MAWVKAATLLLFLVLPAGVLRPEVVPGVQDIVFTAACDGSQQHYMLLLPHSFEPGVPHDLLIALHGQGADRHQFMQRSRGETQATLEVAAAYALILVTPDYRAPASWMGPRAESDLTQIIGELKSRYRIRHLILSGASMGGTGALTYTALHPEIVDAVVAMNGTANLLEYDNYQPAISTSFGGAKDHIPAEYKRRSAEYWPERFTMPVALTIGGHDTTVPPDSVLRLAAILHNLKTPVFLMHRPDGGHETNLADAKAALEFAVQVLAERVR